MSAALGFIRNVPTGVASGAVLLGLGVLLLVGLAIFSKREAPFRRLQLLIREVLAPRPCRHRLTRRTSRAGPRF